MVLFAASTGLRAGEQWAVRWSDIDAATGMLSVERRVDAYGEEGPPKSAAGVRGVPLSSVLLRSLKEWRLQSEFSGDNDLVFPNKKGRYMGHDNLVKRRFKPALVAAEVSDINWHSLRPFHQLAIANPSNATTELDLVLSCVGDKTQTEECYYLDNPHIPDTGENISLAVRAFEFSRHVKHFDL